MLKDIICMAMFKKHEEKYEIKSGKKFNLLKCKINFLRRWNKNVRKNNKKCKEIYVCYLFYGRGLMMENDFNFDVLMNEYVRRNVVGG
jgi:hypothetical protein